MKNENDLDPKKDWVFKLMFTHGEMGNTALIDFLNAFLADSYGSITQADVLNTELINLRFTAFGLMFCCNRGLLLVWK